MRKLWTRHSADRAEQRQSLPYRCAGGCDNRVDKPFNLCVSCAAQDRRQDDTPPEDDAA